MPVRTKAELLNENERLKRKIKRLEKKNQNADSAIDNNFHQNLGFYSELRVIEESINIAIAHFDLKYVLKYANKKYRETVGLPDDKIIGKHLKEVIGEKNFILAKKYLIEAKKGNETSYINKFDFNKGIIWAKVNYVPEIDTKGKIKSIIVFAYDITKEKVAEIELLSSESLLKKVQKVARLGSYVFDIYKREWTSSETLDDILGLRNEKRRDFEIWMELINPEERPEMLSYFQDYVLKQGNRFEREYRIIRYNDRKPRWVFGLGELEFDSSGKPVKMIGTIQDITERKLVELSLEESEELHRKLLSTLPDLIIRTNLTGEIVFVNDQLFTSSGIKSKEELLGKNIFTFLAPEHKEKAFVNTKLMFEGKLGPQEYKLMFGNGIVLETEVNGDVLRNAEGIPSGMVYSIRDITEKNRITKALRESESRYRDLIEFAVDGIMLGSPNGTIIGANSYMQRLSGRTLEELLNSAISSLFDSEELKDIPLRYDLLLRGDIVKSERHILRSDGRKVPVEMHTKMMPDGTYQGIFRDISERKIAEENIKESTEKYRALSEASFDAVFISENGICLEQNVTAREMFGYSDEELVGKHLTDFLVPDNRDEANLKILKEIEGEYEVGVIKKDGTIQPSMVRAKMMFYKGKRVRFTSLTDITLRKQSEEQLRINEMYLRKAEEVAQVGNWLFNLKDKIMLASEGAKTIYGLDVNKMPIEEVKKIPLKEYRPMLDKAMKDLIEKNSKYEINFKIKKPTTGELVDIRSKAEYDAKTQTIFGVVQDITEQKRNEEVFREREKFLETLVDNLPAVIFVKEAQGLSFTGLNKAGEQLLGYSFEELKGKTDHDIYPKDMADFFFATDRRVLEYKKLEDVTEETILRRDGTKRIIHTKKIPLLDNKGIPQFILGISEDITNRLESEKELLKAKEEAEKSNKLKSEFLAQMSHEIRSPISTILNFVTLIKMQIDSVMDEELSSCFGSIDLASKRVIRTIDMILNMSEIQTGTYENKPVELNLISGIFENLRKEFSGFAQSKQLRLIIDKPDHEIKIVGDEYSVTQIFANLIDNAIKYTREGKITVKFTEREKSVTVKVTDTGIGISEEYVPYLFDAFSQEEQGYTRNFEGNGLGLALVKKYCELNHAEISVLSTKGKGTSFKVKFLKK